MNRTPSFFRTDRMYPWPSASWLTAPFQFLAIVVLCAMVVLNCADVIGRELFNSPVFGATELTRLMIPLIVFGAVPIVGYREEHISVDLIDLVYPAKAVNVRQIVLTAITALLMAGVSYQLLAAAADAKEYTEMTEDLRIGLWNVYYFISVMSGLTAILLLLNLIRYARNIGPLSPGQVEEHKLPPPGA